MLGHARLTSNFDRFRQLSYEVGRERQDLLTVRIGFRAAQFSRRQGRRYLPASDLASKPQGNGTGTLLVNYFGNDPQTPRVSYLGDGPEKFRMPDITPIDGSVTKWSALHALLLANVDLIRKYDYIWLPDDDIACRAQDIDRLFQRHAGANNLPACSAGTVAHKLFSWCITLRNPLTRVRWTNFVEVMVPCFHRDLLIKLPADDGRSSRRLGPGLGLADGGRFGSVVRRNRRSGCGYPYPPQLAARPTRSSRDEESPPQMKKPRS